MSFYIQIYSNRELEDQLTKIREVLSDEKHDWEHRVVAVRLGNQMYTLSHMYVGYKCRNLMMLYQNMHLSHSPLSCSSPAEEDPFAHVGWGR